MFSLLQAVLGIIISVVVSECLKIIFILGGVIRLCGGAFRGLLVL